MLERSAARQDRPSALLVSPEAPFPTIGGGALRTACLLYWLAKKYELDVIVFREPGRPDPRESFPIDLVRRVSVIDLPFHSKTTLSRAARNLNRFIKGNPPHVDRFARFPALIERAIGERRYSLGVMEHFWCAPYLQVLGGTCGRAVLDLHNIESVLLRSSAIAAPPLQSTLLGRFASACLELEKKWLPRASLLLVASDEDRERAQSIAPATPVFVVPNTIPKHEVAMDCPREGIVFSGNLEYQPNIAGLKWFRENVWPSLSKSNRQIVFRVIGRNPAAIQHLFAGDPRVIVIGPVDDAIAEIARAEVAIVPILSGSGTRVKIIEAWAAGTPVVSTALGAEGLGATSGVDLLLADRPADFRERIDSLLASPAYSRSIGVQGRKRYESGFTWETAWNRLQQCGL